MTTKKRKDEKKMKNVWAVITLANDNESKIGFMIEKISVAENALHKIGDLGFFPVLKSVRIYTIKKEAYDYYNWVVDTHRKKGDYWTLDEIAETSVNYTEPGGKRNAHDYYIVRRGEDINAKRFAERQAEEKAKDIEKGMSENE